MTKSYRQKQIQRKQQCEREYNYCVYYEWAKTDYDLIEH